MCETTDGFTFVIPTSAVKNSCISKQHLIGLLVLSSLEVRLAAAVSVSENVGIAVPAPV